MRFEGEERRVILFEASSGSSSASLIPNRLMSNRPCSLSGRSKSGLPGDDSP